MELQELAQVYEEETEKNQREIIDGIDYFLSSWEASPQHKVQELLREQGMPMTHDDFDYIEHRIYHDYVAAIDGDRIDPEFKKGSDFKNWVPYEQDLSHYPEVFRMYRQNYAKTDELK